MAYISIQSKSIHLLTQPITFKNMLYYLSAILCFSASFMLFLIPFFRVSDREKSVDKQGKVYYYYYKQEH